MKRAALLLLVASVAAILAARTTPTRIAPAPAAAFGTLPLAFERNDGQAPARFDFLARSASGTAGLSSSGATISRPGARPLSLTLVGAARTEPRALKRLPGKVNHLVGDDPADWRTDIPTFARVRYPGVWPGIDVEWHGNQRRLEYDFVIAAGADPSRIEVRADRALRQARPSAYQVVGGARRSVAVTSVADGRTVRFRLGSYDRTRPLVIDPVVLAYSTYLGGSGFEIAYDIAVDSSGAYITGRTSSTNFNTVPGGNVEGDSAGTDAFVSKLNPAGNALVYSTYLGGNGADEAHAIAIDSLGFAYVVGSTASTDFNTVNPIEGDQGGLDVFVSKLNPAGNTLAYSTYLGGSDDDQGGFGIAVDSTLAAYVVGSTDSTDFNTNQPIQTDSDDTDGFLAKLTAPGNALAYSTYLGGDGDDFAENVAVDAIGSAYVIGTTGSTDFTTVNPIEGDQGGDDVFIAKLSPPGTAFAYSTYLGGGGADVGHGIAVDPIGRAFITGATDSTDFNTSAGRIAGDLPGTDGYVSRLTPTGSLSYSTYLGGSSSDTPNAIAIDGVQAMYVTGKTNSTDFPTVAEFERDANDRDAFVSKLSPAGDFLSHSTYLGGNGVEDGNGIAVDSTGAYVTGFTDSTDFDTRGPIEGDSSFDDVFVSKLAFTDATPPPQPTSTPTPLPPPAPLPPPVALGTSRADRLFGTRFDDTICGLGGNDNLSGFRGDDRLFGDACGRGVLALIRSGNDQLNGGPGKDLLVGGGGNDVFRPGPGRDVVKGGAGNDRIRARDKTRDSVRCGPGRDAVTADRGDRLRSCEIVLRR